MLRAGDDAAIDSIRVAAKVLLWSEPYFPGKVETWQDYECGQRILSQLTRVKLYKRTGTAWLVGLVHILHTFDNF